MVRGDWTLSATLIRSPGITLAPPAPGELVGKSVTFADVRVHRGTIAMVIRVSNISFGEATRIVPDSFKGHPALRVTLGRASEPRPLGGQGTGDVKPHGSGVSMSTLWFVSAGTYNLDISYEGYGSLIRTIEVPSAAGTGQQ